MPDRKCFLYFSPLDMFGEPWPEPPRVGRPRHEPTRKSRALVKRMRERGCEQVEIAKRLGISLPTLRLNYAKQLGSRSKAGQQRAQRDQRKAR